MCVRARLSTYLIIYLVGRAMDALVSRRHKIVDVTSHRFSLKDKKPIILFRLDGRVPLFKQNGTIRKVRKREMLPREAHDKRREDSAVVCFDGRRK